MLFQIPSNFAPTLDPFPAPMAPKETSRGQDKLADANIFTSTPYGLDHARRSGVSTLSTFNE